MAFGREAAVVLESWNELGGFLERLLQFHGAVRLESR